MPSERRLQPEPRLSCLIEGVLRKRGRFFWHSRTCRLISGSIAHGLEDQSCETGEEQNVRSSSLHLFFSNAENMRRQPVSRWKRFAITETTKVFRIGSEEERVFRIVDGDRFIALKALNKDEFTRWTQAIVSAIAELRSQVGEQQEALENRQSRIASSHEPQNNLDRRRNQLRELGINATLVEEALQNFPLSADINEILDWVTHQVSPRSRGEEKREDFANRQNFDWESLDVDIDVIVDDEYEDGNEENEESDRDVQDDDPTVRPPPPPYSLHPTLSQLGGMHDPDHAQHSASGIDSREAAPSRQIQRYMNLRQPLVDTTNVPNGVTAGTPLFFADAEVVCITEEGMEQVEQENVAVAIPSLPSVPSLSTVLS